MTDERERPVNAPADVAPELVEGASGDEARMSKPLPRVPDVPEEDKPALGVPQDGGQSGNGSESRERLKPIRFRRADGRSQPDGPDGSDDGHTRSADPDALEGCGCGSGCGCGERTPVTDGSRPVADGGATPKNVDGEGRLGDLSFTPPAEGRSQDVYDDRPDRRVGVPEGVDLATPGYSIRQEMNDIETPEDTTWFMELDEAVIDADRCIQCGTCVASCPSDSIGVGEDGLPELVKMCTGCSLCWDFCPRGGLRYERQWKITGGEDNVKGAGDPITEFSARVEEDWREDAQDGGVVTSVLVHLLEAGEIDGALVATESDEEPWKAEAFLATTPGELVENAGSFYNQTMALGNLDLDRWAEKLPEKDPEDLSLALVGTPCEIEGIRALQDFEWEYGSEEAGVRAIDYTIALMCTKNFNYYRLVGDLIEEQRGIDREEVGKMDVLHGKMMVYDRDGEMILEEDVETFHGAALKGCDECADFTGYCADLTVGSVGSSDEYSSVVVRTERGLDAWELTAPDLDYHDLEDRSAVGKLQGWDKKRAFESLERPFDPDAPRFIEYAEHVEHYGTQPNPHEADH